MNTRKRLNHFGDASTIWYPPKTSAVVKWNQSEPRRVFTEPKEVCTADGRASEVTQALWRNPEDCEWVPVISSGVIYTESLVLLFSDCDCLLPLEGRKY